MNKQEIIDIVNKVSMTNTNIGAYGDGFEKAITMIINEINQIEDKELNVVNNLTKE